MAHAPISSDPLEMLRHYALGDMPGYTGDEGSPTAWLREAHRGVHLLKEIRIPRTQRRYVRTARFELRFDQAFEETLRRCASTQRTGHTWITPELVEGFLSLHRMGFAHSYEAWQGSTLAGGCFGVQIGSYLSVESMFYTISNASKFAYGRLLEHARERGFMLVDSNPVKDESRNYGEEWIPQWRFEQLLGEAVSRPATLIDGHPPALLPSGVARALTLARLMRKVKTRLFGG